MTSFCHSAWVRFSVLSELSVKASGRLQNTQRACCALIVGCAASNRAAFPAKHQLPCLELWLPCRGQARRLMTRVTTGAIPQRTRQTGQPRSPSGPPSPTSGRSTPSTFPTRTGRRARWPSPLPARKICKEAPLHPPMWRLSQMKVGPFSMLPHLEAHRPRLAQASCSVSRLDDPNRCYACLITE